MKPIKRQKLLKALRRACGKLNLDVTLVQMRGDHEGWVITDPKREGAITIVITSDKEVSAGVQRDISAYVRKMIGRVPFAEVLYEVLKKICGG